MLFQRLIRLPRALIVAGAVMVAALLTVSGVAGRLDRLLDPARVAAWTRPASGQVVVVEMDAASIAAIKRWPWPRENYATVVDRLRTAGAASITFDVDLSSPSTASGDAALARALARAEGLVALPTFAQQARSGDARSLDALPIGSLRAHAALASVSMQPDPDGVVRRAPFGTITADTPRPSLSSYMAHRAGRADEFFPIDFNIDPASLPRVSFAAVRDGRFDPALVRGRDVIIGATAIEMGDRYATPHWGVIPGVIVQALATETLLRGIPIEGGTWALLLVSGLLGWLIVRSWRGAPVVAMLAPALLFVGVVAVHHAAQVALPLAPGLIVIGLAAAAAGGLRLIERLERERGFDSDTGLPNRRMMVRDLGAGHVAVALIGNFDNLLTIGGERAGQDLVLRLADRLRLSGGTIYRLDDRTLGFTIPREADLDEHLAGLRSIMRQPVEVAGRLVDAAVHVGVASVDGTTRDQLTEATRAAAKAAADGVFWRHGGSDRVAIERQLILMGELDRAIETGEIEVFYQPKLAIAEGRITSAEALVRWRHPERGMVPPDMFIPLAEQAGRIAPLTLFVLDRVVDDLAGWTAAGLTITAAVNVSAKLVADPAFDAAVRRVIESGRVSPAALILEVTESATLEEPERAASVLRAWRALGVAISMDDYGTGHSTLSYLKQLPLSELKIDRSFVQNAHRHPEDALMVRSTIDLAHGLGLKVVAEGIEDEACLDFLRGAGCDMAQGYLIGRPAPGSELLALLETARAAA